MIARLSCLPNAISTDSTLLPVIFNFSFLFHQVFESVPESPLETVKPHKHHCLSLCECAQLSSPMCDSHSCSCMALLAQPSANPLLCPPITLSSIWRKIQLSQQKLFSQGFCVLYLHVVSPVPSPTSVSPWESDSLKYPNFSLCPKNLVITKKNDISSHNNLKKDFLNHITESTNYS